MATLAVKSVIVPIGLCPMLLVYGAIIRPERITQAETQMRRAEGLETSMKEDTKEQVMRHIKFGLKHVGGLRALERTEEINRLPAGKRAWV